MLNNIPAELRALPQWVNWRYELVEGRKTKVPYSPTGRMASVIDPTSWVDFNIAVQALKGFDGIGFVLSKDDPYTIIDLDNKPEKPCSPEQLARHTKIYEVFDSYTERSISGTGVHIIIRGKLPSGVHRDNVEAYSDGRYMICTGDVLRATTINDCQPLLDILYGEMKPPEKTTLFEVEATLSDEAILDRAMRASNGDKFNSLCSGNMEGYPSQSEADFALLSIIAFYTQSNEQVRRIFRMTALGKRAKAIKNDTYLNFALEKVRAQQPTPVDMEQMRKNVEAIMAPKSPIPTPEPQIEVPAPTIAMELPPGLVGEIAQYFYNTSIRPVAEISMIAAIACVAGVVGRSYNISGAGLAQYLILLARTGTGKESMSSGISRLFHSIQPQLPMATQFLGPAVFASGPALHRVLSEKPCFVSVLGEFGFTVQRLSNPRANSAELTLKQLILDSYGKSGYGQVLQPSVYSDKEKNINPIASPNITILGESTPESFYDGLDQSHIASGFLSRFMILEYLGDRPDINNDFNTPPSDSLKQKFADLVTVAITIQNNNTVCPVGQDPDGAKLLINFNHRVDTKIRGAQDTIREIWNRAHLKALKLAGVIAVGVNSHKPLVTGAIANWAVNMVQKDCEALQARFTSGDIGQGDSKQINDVKRIIENYINLPFSIAEKFGANEKLHKAYLIPYQFVIKKTYSLASFKNDKMGSTIALKRTIQTMIDMGMIKEFSKEKLETKYDYRGIAYHVEKNW
jgi:hypothetical protein